MLKYRFIRNWHGYQIGDPADVSTFGKGMIASLLECGQIEEVREEKAIYAAPADKSMSTRREKVRTK